jgi:hypothetical protein
LKRDKLQNFATLVERQRANDGSARSQLNALQVALEDSYCLFNLFQEWQGAFSFSPGRVEALKPIVSLARKLAVFAEDDTLAMYRTPEWAQLVNLRGPCEAVLEKVCRTCRRSFVAIGTSGFYDALPLICRRCGDVYFKSFYDEEPTPTCRCGGEYASGCPHCRSSEATISSQISPYEYFAHHRYTRGPGA